MSIKVAARIINKHPLLNIVCSAIFWPKEIIHLMLTFVPNGIKYIPLAPRFYTSSISANPMNNSSEQLTISDELTKEVCDAIHFGSFAQPLYKCPGKWQVKLVDTKHITGFCIGLTATDTVEKFVPDVRDDIEWYSSHTMSVSYDDEVNHSWRKLCYQNLYADNPVLLFENCTACSNKLVDGDVFVIEQTDDALLINRNNCACQVTIPYSPVKKECPYVSIALHGVVTRASFSFSTLLW